VDHVGNADDGQVGALPPYGGRTDRHALGWVGDLADGTGCRYVGSCLLPWTAVRGLSATPSGLYEVLWRDLDAERRLDLVRTDEVSVDCGTPGDYLAANLHASGGRDVVGAGAVVEGSIERCVVWPGAYVGPHEHLVDTVRAGSRDQPVTVRATVGT
jgi:hypothetical protein